RAWARTRRTFSEGAWSLRRRLALAFVIAGALLLLGALLGGLALNSMVGDVNLQVDRLDPAARNTSYLLASLLNEETGVRGYALTGQQSFLRPYQQGSAQSAGYVRTLQLLIAPYPKLRQQLREVEAQAARWRTDYADPAVAAVNQHHSVSTGLETVGKQDFDRLRSQIAMLNRDLLAE